MFDESPSTQLSERSHTHAHAARVSGSLVCSLRKGLQAGQACFWAFQLGTRRAGNGSEKKLGLGRRADDGTGGMNQHAGTGRENSERVRSSY